MTLSEAIREIEQGHAKRITVPGQWKVWREGERVQALVLRKEPIEHTGRFIMKCTCESSYPDFAGAAVGPIAVAPNVTRRAGA